MANWLWSQGLRAFQQISKLIQFCLSLSMGVLTSQNFWRICPSVSANTQLLTYSWPLYRGSIVLTFNLYMLSYAWYIIPRLLLISNKMQMLCKYLLYYIIHRSTKKKVCIVVLILKTTFHTRLLIEGISDLWIHKASNHIHISITITPKLSRGGLH